MKEEFDLQGQDFSKRGKKLTEAIQAWKELWKGGWVEWHGEHYDIPRVHPRAAPRRSRSRSTSAATPTPR